MTSPVSSAVALPALSYQQFLQILLADIGKAPLLLADINTLIADAKKLAADAGFPLDPPAAPVAVPHEVMDLEERVITAYRNVHGTFECNPNLAPLMSRDQFEAVGHKLGDGTLLKGIGAFLSSPLGQQLLGLLLGKLLPTGG